MKLLNGYDKDGNFVGMKHYGSSNNLADDFGYSYFLGTNKLQTIGEGLTSYGYTYDKNGNMTSDQLNRTSSIKYDHRNLMTEIRAIKTEANPDPFGTPTIDVLYLTNYRYDEAGNRVRKVRYKYTGSDPDPVFVTEGSNPSWTLQSDEFYVRDVSGKEIAIYSGSSLTQWNIWGLDNVGKINADTTRNYYLKDHLGSIRVILNSTNTVISAQDYDAWGYPLENRTYNASAMKYDFTGKERDNETSYDYFGARYYDSRIERWGQVDPQLSKLPGWTPYRAFLDNPINVLDPDGKIEIPKEYKTLYPKLYSYLEKNLEKIGTEEKVLNAMVEETGRTAEQIKAGLRITEGTGVGPFLLIKPLEGNLLGHYDKTTYTIEIDDDYVNKLEHSTGDALEVYSFLVTALIIHEGAHAAAIQTDRENEPYSNKNYIDGYNRDVGDRVEIKAWDRIHTSYDKAARTLNWKNYENNNPKRYKEK